MPRVRKLAPYFIGQAVIDGKVNQITLTDYQGRYLVLLFYPMDFTYVSPTEILAFSDRAKEFDRNNCSVVAVSTDSEFTHLAWMKLPKEEGGLGGVINITLLSDKSMKISRDYGVLDRDIGISHRGLYIIDVKSAIRHITMNDLEVGRSVEETLRLVKAFQYTDKYMKVCQVDWKPGESGIRPDPLQTGRYFEGYFGIPRKRSNIKVKDIQPYEGSFVEERKPAKQTMKVEKIVESPSVLSLKIYPKLLLQTGVMSGTKIHKNTSTPDDSNKSKGIKDERSSGLKEIYHPAIHILESTMEDSLKKYEDIIGRPVTRNGTRNYKVYNTTPPSVQNIALNNEQKTLNATIQTTSESDIKSPERTSLVDSSKDVADSKHLQDSQMKQYIYNYYNDTYDKNKNAIVLRSDSASHECRYELKNNEIYKYNDRISKENQQKLRQDKEDNRESSSLNKISRLSNVGGKEIAHVKDKVYDPLNNVLNIRSLQYTNNSTGMESRGKSTERKPNLDRLESPQKHQYYQEQHESSRRTPAHNAERYRNSSTKSDTASRSSREDYHLYRSINKDYENELSSRNRQTSYNEPTRQMDENVPRITQSSSQILMDTNPPKILKSSMKKSIVTSRLNNTNSNYFRTIKEESYRENTAAKFMKAINVEGTRSNADRYRKKRDYYESGEKAKSRSDGGTNTLNWGGVHEDGRGLKQGLNYGINGHLII